MVVSRTPEMTAFAVHPLNNSRGVTNIGSHPDNDVVVHGSGIRPFHFMLDHRQKPYRIIILDPTADVCLGDIKLTGSDPKEVADLNQVSFGGFQLRVQEPAGGGLPENIGVVPVGVQTDMVPARLFASGQSSGLGLVTAGIPTAGAAAASLAAASPVPAAPTPAAASPEAQAPRAEEVILVQLPGASATVAVNETATYTLVVINGGDIVASFDIAAQGVPADWVEIVPARLNLFEGGRGTAEIRITPPRASSSLAKVYPIKINVTSSNYQGALATANATLEITPYYDFSVAALNPRNRSASYRAKSGNVTMNITNRGNSLAGYQVTAQDEDNLCQFSLPIDGQDLIKQAEVHVAAGETYPVPLVITPQKRSVVRLSGKSYNYTVTVGSLEDKETVRTVGASFTSKPLFGILSILIAVVSLLLAIYFIFKPEIKSFDVAKPIIRLGEPAQLIWKVSAFTTNLRIEGVEAPVSATTSQISVVPTVTATRYTLYASNFLSTLLRMGDLTSPSLTVLAIPPYPDIDTFFIDKTFVLEGDSLTVKWSTVNADEIYLTVEGVTETIKKEEASGARTFKIQRNTLVTLEARNKSGSVTRSTFVKFAKPSIHVVKFDVTPTQIIKGQKVTVSWEVEGDGIDQGQITIAPFTNPLPKKDSIIFYPEASMEFVLTVKNRDQEYIDLKSVGVGAAPVAPVINFLKVVPNELTIAGEVLVSWSVTGETTDIVLKNLDGVIKTGLPPEGFLNLPVGKTTSLMLIAYNQGLSAAASQDIVVATSKPVSVKILSISPSTPIRVGNSVTVQFEVRPLDASGKPSDPKTLGYPEVTGKVVVYNGLNRCQADDVGQGACVMKIERIGGDSLVATYNGDANYARTTSAAFTGLTVVAEPATWITTVSSKSVVVGQPVTISFLINPSNAAATVPVTGKVDVTVDGVKLCPTVDLSPSTVKDYPLAGAGSCPPVPFSTIGSKSVKFTFWNSDTYSTAAKTDDLVAVSPAPAVISLDGLSADTVVGQAFDIQVLAEVDKTGNGAGIPTGTVTIKDAVNTSDICTTTLSTQGRGTCRLTLRQAGSPRNLQVQYSGNGNFTVVPFSAVHNVLPSSTKTVITSVYPASGSTEVGQPALVNFTVSPTNGAGVPTGLVQVNLCSGAATLSNGSGSCTISPLLNSGTNFITATYLGDSNFSASPASNSFPYDVKRATTTVGVSVIGGATPTYKPVAMSFTVGYAPTLVPSTSIGSVVVYASTGESCTVTAYIPTDLDTHTCSISFTTEGPRSISAKFFGNQDYGDSVTSGTVTHNVLRSVAINLTLDRFSSLVYQNVYFNTTFSYTGSVAPTGRVEVTADTGEKCEFTMPGAASCPIPFQSAGSRSKFTLYYDGDSVFAGNTLVYTYSLTINRGDSTITNIYYFPNSPKIGNTVTFTFQVISTNTDPPSFNGNVYVTASTGEKCTYGGSDSIPLATNGTGACQIVFTHSGLITMTLVYQDIRDTYGNPIQLNDSSLIYVLNVNP